MVNKKRRPSRKESMLQAAVGLVASKGIDALTIDALATVMGVTKGGIQYHFPSKHQLFMETLEYLLFCFDSDVTEKAAEANGRGRWLKAYVELTVGKITAEDRVAGAMLAILTCEDPRAEPYRRYTSQWRKLAIADGVDPATAMVVRLAADSMWTERVFGGASVKESKLVRERLLSMIDVAIQ
jgi:AcrR family transcriptional regulator